jgi:alpha-amylase/alpha-mannosidase (GH57 family)
LRDRYVCVHGHFYQPPRENPWTGSVDEEASAAPWHDWNERITDECYAPNASAPSTYERINFDVGPTLMDWLGRHRPDVHRGIVEGDAAAATRFDGRGGAIAHAYNHMILPLANERDRRTQVRWGAADFEHRFGRRPEGMWLPETAVDLATLEALADEGILFTVLAPRQADQVRFADAETWSPVEDGMAQSGAYRQALPSGRDIALFFYDGELSRAVAFDGLLHDGDEYGRRLRMVAAAGSEPRLVSVATDGESYGHHHPHGEMALVRALDEIDRDPDVNLTTFAAYLDRHPPRAQVRIVEDSSWSCAHGVSRWTGACECGSRDGASVSWRQPLRVALDGLRDALARRFEQVGEPLLRDPWAARDDYIRCLLDPSPEVRENFLAEHGTSGASGDSVFALLEQQRCAMLMFTSCGWFFDDPEGLEPRQVLRYAARALDVSWGGSETTSVVRDFHRALGPLASLFARVIDEDRPGGKAGFNWQAP